MEAVYVETTDGNVFSGNLFVRQISNSDVSSVFVYVNEECFLDGRQFAVEAKVHVVANVIIFAKPSERA
jgi:hypothetical protein